VTGRWRVVVDSPGLLAEVFPGCWIVSLLSKIKSNHIFHSMMFFDEAVLFRVLKLILTDQAFSDKMQERGRKHAYEGEGYRSS